MPAITDLHMTDLRMDDFDIYSEHGQLRRPLAWSLGLHLAFAAFVTLYAMFIQGFRGEGWGSGGGGDAMGATLVSSVPLPANPTETTNVLATESKGLSKSQPMVQEKEPEAIPIPDKNTKVKPKPVTSATQRKPEPRTTRVESNSVWRGWPGQRPLHHERGRRQGRIWIYRKWRRFRQPIFLVRTNRAEESHRKLVEV